MKEVTATAMKNIRLTSHRIPPRATATSRATGAMIAWLLGISPRILYKAKSSFTSCSSASIGFSSAFFENHNMNQLGVKTKKNHSANPNLLFLWPSLTWICIIFSLQKVSNMSKKVSNHSGLVKVYIAKFWIFSSKKLSSRSENINSNNSLFMYRRLLCAILSRIYVAGEF